MDFMIIVFVVLSFALGCLGSAGAVKWGRQLALMDRPSERSSHTSSTPKGGGIGILLACLFFGALADVSLFVLVPAAGISVIGFIGDRYDINPKIRLGLQLCAAIMFLYGHYGHLAAMAGAESHDGIKVFGVFLFWLLFIAGTANFYNFMDGINGIAGITAIIAFSFLGGYGWLNGKSEALILFSFVIVSACAGFLPWNFPSARVFMGDVGSLLLGFLFAALVFLFADSPSEFILMVSFLLPFYADEIITMAERLKDGISLTRPHRSHLYQVLVNEFGWSHCSVAVGYGLLQFLSGIVVWAAVEQGILWGIFAFCFFFAVFGLVNHITKSRLV